MKAIEYISKLRDRHNFKNKDSIFDKTLEYFKKELPLSQIVFQCSLIGVDKGSYF